MERGCDEKTITGRTDLMNRVEFTRKITYLLVEMIIEGDRPIIDFVKRTLTEQQRMYRLGRSKCDGIKNRSRHQLGKAMDIYFINENGAIDWSPEKYERWHKRWEVLGGKKMIIWDAGHFE